MACAHQAVRNVARYPSSRARFSPVTERWGQRLVDGSDRLFHAMEDTMTNQPDQAERHHDDRRAYVRFGVMIATSTLVMFILMYFNTYQLEHVRFSQTRAWMALVMGAAMAIIMLSFMLKMYKMPKVNVAIVAGSVIVLAGALWLVRSQETVDDISYMRAMIPHHSIAIMTSERAHIRDPRVRRLADGIIEAQVREIAEMDQLIADLERHPVPAGARDLPAQPAQP